ncbi:hypothetical protein [Fictibacillus sp. BK138]|uniref:hypothetical protein n=1 Tax=Fictibacillus sp. BK138 TaxID=2512121 RepID=UPI0010294DD6|nr:hypothetical protein [Fictibacillus sp. BK138]RZT23620.1 hypothetical protein EV282_2713 [Fictibacillus sp. BK138]
MKVKNVFFAIVIASLWLTGCTIGTTGTNNQIEENEDDFPPSMTGLINVQGKEYKIEAGNYKWKRKKGSETEVVQTDAASPNQIGEYYRAIKLESNTNINIDIEDNPKVSVYQWNQNGRDKEVTLKNNHLSVPSSKGRYIYEVLAKWPNGEVSYTFVVEVN